MASNITDVSSLLRKFRFSYLTSLENLENQRKNVRTEEKFIYNIANVKNSCAKHDMASMVSRWFGS